MDEELVLKRKEQAEQQEQFNFEYNNRTVESYQKYKLPLPSQYVGEANQELTFLGRVNPEKMHEIERKITRILRIKKPDALSKGKHIIKEYLIVYENWYGNDWKGEPIPPVGDHCEGMYYEQEIAPMPFVNGRPTGEYKRIGQHEVYYLEFTKERLDEIIGKPKQIADKDEIIYHIKMGSAQKGAPKYRNTFTYDEFSRLSFDELVKLTL